MREAGTKSGSLKGSEIWIRSHTEPGKMTNSRQEPGGQGKEIGQEADFAIGRGYTGVCVDISVCGGKLGNDAGIQLGSICSLLAQGHRLRI